MQVIERIREDFAAHFLLWVAMCLFLAFVLSSSYALGSAHITYNVIVFIILGGIAYVSLVKNYIHYIGDNKLLLYLLILLVVSVIAGTLHSFVTNFMHHGQPSVSYRIYLMLIYLFLLIFGSSLEFYGMSTKLKLQLLEGEKYKNKQELDLLKARIEPHFLFNALNNIYALAKRNDPRTEDYIMDVSTLLRYVVDQSRNDLVSLAEEFDFMRSYVELERTRLSSKDICNYSVQLNDAVQKPIAPLLIFPFLENAFKHSFNPDGTPRYIAIDISVNQHVLSANIINNKGAVNEKRNRERALSVQQARKRLATLNRAAKLDIIEEDNLYKVTLRIPLA